MKGGRSVVVVGMHRSGTSALTRVLNLLGLHLGAEDNPHKGWGNPLGHWENESLSDENDRVLVEMGGTWWAPPLLPEGWIHEDKARELTGRMKATFSRNYGSEPWVWKDPRTCLTLPLWQITWDRLPVLVLVHRRPYATLSSLLARESHQDDFHRSAIERLARREIARMSKHSLYDLGWALWERYTRRALQNATGSDLIVVAFEDMLNDPYAFTPRLTKMLHQLGVQMEGDPSVAASSIASRVHQQPRDHREVRLTESQRHLYDVVQSLNGEHYGFSHPKLPPEPSLIQSLFDRELSLQAKRAGSTWRNWARHLLEIAIPGDKGEPHASPDTLGGRTPWTFP